MCLESGGVVSEKRMRVGLGNSYVSEQERKERVGSLKDWHNDKNLKVNPKLGYHVIMKKRQL